MRYNFNFFILLFLALASSRLFSFTLIENNYFNYLEVIIACIIVISCLLNFRKILNSKVEFPEVKWLTIISVFSFLPALIFHNQQISLSLTASRISYFWLGYYLLKINKVKVKDLHNVMIFVGMCWSTIMILQQITYPIIYFNFLNDSEFEINRYEERGNLLRIFVDGSSFGFYFLFFYWKKLLKNVNIKTIFLFSIGLLGILLTGSRQIIFSVFLVFLFSILSKIKSITRYNTKFIFVLISLIFFIIAFAGDYLLSLINLSVEQNVTSSNYIRILEIKFFAIDYWPNSFAMVIGNGWDHSLSDYGKEIINYKEMYGFYRSDVGLIGAFNKFGALYLFVVVSMIFRILRRNNKLIVPEIIKYFFLLLLLTSISGVNFFETSSWIFVLISLLYITDKYNEKNLNFNSHI